MRVLLACVRAWARHSQVLQFVQENVSKMRGACADVKMYQNQQIPLPYVHLLELLVTVYLTLAPAALVSQLLWVAPFVSSFVTLFFYGFFVLGTKILLDPFSTTVSVSSSARNTQKLYKHVCRRCRELWGEISCLVCLLPAPRGSPESSLLLAVRRLAVGGGWV